MALSLIEPTNQLKPEPLIGENYQFTLNQSIQNLLAEFHKEAPNFSHFVDIFYQLMQAKSDPPLESIWVFSALQFRSRSSTRDDCSNRFSIANDLFQLVSACSASCSSSKAIALLAPVMFEMYNLTIELLGKDLALKRERKVMREVKSLIDVIVGHISVCCCKDVTEDGNAVDTGLIMPVADLVCVWMDGNGDLETFLPLVSGEVRRQICEGGCDVNYLAGVVIVEAFLLKLCLNIRLGIRGVELEKELRSWVVSSITSFQNFYFFETIVRMLLEPTLPVTFLLSSDNGVLLRKVLYDAIILVEYSFLNPERAVHLSAVRMKGLALTRLIVTHEAIRFFRDNEDQKRVVSYTSAFSSSQLPSQIIKWIRSQIGMDEKASKSNGSSPKALIKWLLNLEDQGIRVFDDSISKCQAKIALDSSKADYEPPDSELGGKKVDVGLPFYIDNKGEEDRDENDRKVYESMSDAFVAAAHMMQLTENGGKKRKERGSADKKKKIKYLKYDLSDDSNSARELFPSIHKDGLSSESEVENPLSDEDVETEEQ